MKGHILKKSLLNVHNVPDVSQDEISFLDTSRNSMPLMPHRPDREVAEGKVQVVSIPLDLQEVERIQLLAMLDLPMEYHLIQP
jgi:hypothetical protein